MVTGTPCETRLSMAFIGRQAPGINRPRYSYLEEASFVLILMTTFCYSKLLVLLF